MIAAASRRAALLLLVAPLVIRAQDTTAIGDTVPRRAGVRVCAGGDVTLGSNLDPAWARMAEQRLRAQWGRSAHPDSLVAPLRPLVADADIVFLNVEGAIGAGPAPRKCGPASTSCFAFRSPPSAAAALRSVAPEAQVVGNVANNHARDAGQEGLLQTVERLGRAGVHVTGADTLATPVALPSGDTVAFLGFYTSAEAPDARDLNAVRRHVARARERWRMVVVSTHMGSEGRDAQRTRDRTEIFLGTIDRGNPVAFARTAFEAGAMLVIGHGPHVMRGAEWRDGRLALYSLGNLLTYGPFGNREPTNRGAIVCATLSSSGQVADAEVRSTRQLAPGVLEVDPSGRAAALVDSLSALDFPRTGARVAGGGEMPDGRLALVPRDTAAARGATSSGPASAPAIPVKKSPRRE